MKPKAVVAVAPSGNVAGWFDSLHAAARVCGSDSSVYTIRRSINSDRYRAYGFRWYWKDDYLAKFFERGTDALAWTPNPYYKSNGFGRSHKKGLKLSEETKKKMSAIVRKRWKDGVYQLDRMCYRNTGKKVSCKETGEEYRTIKEFAIAVGVSYDIAKVRIRKGKLIEGRLYVYG